MVGVGVGVVVVNCGVYKQTHYLTHKHAHLEAVDSDFGTRVIEEVEEGRNGLGFQHCVLALGGYGDPVRVVVMELWW